MLFRSLTLYLLVDSSKKGQSIALGTKDNYDSHQGGIRVGVGESIIENSKFPNKTSIYLPLSQRNLSH